MSTHQKDRYQPLEHIGSGTTSRVEKARDNVIGRTVALKTFVHGFAEDIEEQFLREAQLVGQLSHPAVVQLYDVGFDRSGTPFLVMEYIAGETLEQYLESSTLTIQRACAWAADLANALALAHRTGIIHGDVKPGNIFITPDNKVKLGDFGIARLTTQNSSSGQVLGTPAYLAPEQIQDERQDQRSDQFSFGVVFYQMLTGVKPFDGKTVGAVCSQILNENPEPPSHHNPTVPPALDEVLVRCLAKDPKHRFASCEELAKSLYPFSRQRSKPRALAPKSWWNAPATHREVWMAAAACLLLALFVQVPRFLEGHFGVPQAPVHSFRPGVPYEALAYTRQTVRETPTTDFFTPQTQFEESQEESPRTIRAAKLALADLNRPASRSVSAATPVSISK
jgi:serine/threonine protein kinase